MENNPEKEAKTDMEVVLFFIEHINHPCEDQCGNNVRDIYIREAKELLSKLKNLEAKKLLEDTILKYSQVNESEKTNPNSISELIDIGKDLPTSPDKVYRSVQDQAAIDDIYKSGIVRNKQEAGLIDKSRWGKRVFWSKGAEGKYHIVPPNGYVIEAPLSVAQQRTVTKDDITAIYKKNDKGEVVNILEKEQ